MNMHNNRTTESGLTRFSSLEFTDAQTPIKFHWQIPRDRPRFVRLLEVIMNIRLRLCSPKNGEKTKKRKHLQMRFGWTKTLHVALPRGRGTDAENKWVIGWPPRTSDSHWPDSVSARFSVVNQFERCRREIGALFHAASQGIWTVEHSSVVNVRTQAQVARMRLACECVLIMESLIHSSARDVAMNWLQPNWLDALKMCASQNDSRKSVQTNKGISWILAEWKWLHRGRDFPLKHPARARANLFAWMFNSTTVSLLHAEWQQNRNAYCVRRVSVPHRSSLFRLNWQLTRYCSRITRSGRFCLFDLGLWMQSRQTSGHSEYSQRTNGSIYTLPHNPNNGN